MSALSIHPFPARMAPDLALDALSKMRVGSVVLDQMTGSGTVARQAKELGLSAQGFDLDPLAVLISKVGTTRVDDDQVERESRRLIAKAKSLHSSGVCLPWIDGDEAAESFIRFWFGDRQRDDLRRIAFLLANPARLEVSNDVADVLRIALSRIIVTKKQSASLAQDTSHSRPHRVTEETDYDVFDGFERSLRVVRRRVALIPRHGSVTISRGDARDLVGVASESVDAVLTSPPYLNAIDYMRGHKMSLVWLGHSYRELSKTRSTSIGAERRPDEVFDVANLQSIKGAMGDLSTLPNRHQGMIERYVIDLHKMIAETQRVLKPKATATFVMGNSCLRGVFIRNSEALVRAAEMVGFGKIVQSERDLPSSSRYLPTPESGSLSKRMRKEVILTLTNR